MRLTSHETDALKAGNLLDAMIESRVKLGPPEPRQEEEFLRELAAGVSAERKEAIRIWFAFQKIADAGHYARVERAAGPELTVPRAKRRR
jgi:hypothetical protein